MQLGLTVTDRITGFTGIVTAYVQYISGCNQCLVTPRVGADGRMGEAAWLDVQRLAVDAAAPTVVLDNGDNPGFDRAPPIR